MRSPSEAVRGPGPPPIAGTRLERLSSLPDAAEPRGPNLLAARHAAGTTRSNGATKASTKPTPRMARFTSIPGLGSATRAGPIGINGDAAMATATATSAPKRVTIPTRRSDNTTRSRRLIPRALKTGCSLESRRTWRPMSWDMTASAISPARAAKMARAIASGWIARSVAAACASRSPTKTCPPVLDENRGEEANELVWLKKADLFAPARRVTAPPSDPCSPL